MSESNSIDQRRTLANGRIIKWMKWKERTAKWSAACVPNCNSPEKKNGYQVSPLPQTVSCVAYLKPFDNLLEIVVGKNMTPENAHTYFEFGKPHTKKRVCIGMAAPTAEKGNRQKHETSFATATERILTPANAPNRCLLHDRLNELFRLEKVEI